MRRITRLLIANRGEIAVRIARTCRELGIVSVGVHSDVDRHGLHVRACDLSVGIGGDSPATSYLRGDDIVAAAVRAGADAVHPGFGFLAEQASFARAVTAAGLVWVGPSPDVIDTFGDKIAAKEAVVAAGVPVLPSVAVGEATGDDLVELAADVGFPLMIKAAAGGGGKGMRIVRDPADLADAVAAARREAAGAFDDDRVFLERQVVRARHVEVQILGDEHGTVLHLGDRDCSVQRRHQKVIEEAPAPGLAPEVMEALREAAVAAGRSVGYTNAGTVEFLVDGRPDADHPFAFLEVNTRLQVEHPVTEAVTGLDLVALQLAVAEGRPLPIGQDDVRFTGHAIEARLYAENPANDYLPVAGALRVMRPATGPDIRWDAGVEEGSTVSVHYDPMVAKVIAHGHTRDVAAARLAGALERSLLLGLVTNRDLLVGVLRHDAFLDGDLATSFLDDHFADPASRFRVPSDDDARLAAIAAVVAGRWSVGEPPVPVGFSNTGLGPESVGVTVGGRRLIVELDLGRASRVRVTEEDAEDDGAWQSLTVDGAVDGKFALEVDDLVVRVDIAADADDVQVVLPGGNVTVRVDARFPTTAVADDPGTSRAPMPGVVVEVAVAVGDEVSEGALLAIVEAMKMEHRIVAAVAGVVTEVAVTAGQQLDADATIVVLDPT